MLGHTAGFIILSDLHLPWMSAMHDHVSCHTSKQVGREKMGLMPWLAFAGCINTVNVIRMKHSYHEHALVILHVNIGWAAQLPKAFHEAIEPETVSQQECLDNLFLFHPANKWRGVMFWVKTSWYWWESSHPQMVPSWTKKECHWDTGRWSLFFLSLCHSVLMDTTV